MLARLLQRLQQFDWVLMFAVGILFSIGIATIYSVGLGKEPQDLFFFRKQLATFGGALLVAVFIGCINYRQIKNFSVISYVVACALLASVLFFGETVRGTRGWFYLGSFGFQPAELAKLALIVTLAQYFHAYTRQIHRLRHVFISGLIAALPVTLIALQPDFGSALILASIWLGIILMSGIPKRYIASIALICLLTLSSAWVFFFKDYQKDRIRAFVSPTTEQAGRSYNVRQSIIAIGSGQLVGRGLGYGTQSHLKFLPENQTDFIFAVIAEELGFFGVSAVLGFWGLIFYRFSILMRRARDDFALFTILGLSLMFIIEVTINIGGNLGLLPVTGIVLPFVSYGGSALIAAVLAIGLAQSIASHSK